MKSYICISGDMQYVRIFRTRLEVRWSDSVVVAVAVLSHNSITVSVQYMYVYSVSMGMHV